MKRWYGYCAGVIILFNTITVDASQKFTDEQLQKLAHERTTNLVIINDVIEPNSDVVADDISQLYIGAVSAELMRTLSSDQLQILKKCFMQNSMHQYQKKL